MDCPISPGPPPGPALSFRRPELERRAQILSQGGPGDSLAGDDRAACGTRRARLRSRPQQNIAGGRACGGYRACEAVVSVCVLWVPIHSGLGTSTFVSSGRRPTNCGRFEPAAAPCHPLGGRFRSCVSLYTPIIRVRQHDTSHNTRMGHMAHRPGHRVGQIAPAHRPVKSVMSTATSSRTSDRSPLALRSPPCASRGHVSWPSSVLPPELRPSYHAQQLPGEGDVRALQPEQRELHVHLLHRSARGEHDGREVDES